MSIYLIPFFLQGFAMFFDEFYFHRRRRLPLWEKIGHPIDTFSVFVCYLFIWLYSPSFIHTNIYIGLCCLSCILITKDEFLHSKVCTGGEMWLHSTLFILHPICFFCAGLLWLKGLGKEIIAFQISIVISFFIYQIIYWSFYDTNQQRHLQ